MRSLMLLMLLTPLAATAQDAEPAPETRYKARDEIIFDQDLSIVGELVKPRGDVFDEVRHRGGFQFIELRRDFSDRVAESISRVK